jgi:hypothetical protein
VLELLEIEEGRIRRHDPPRFGGNVVVMHDPPEVHRNGVAGPAEGEQEPVPAAEPGLEYHLVGAPQLLHAHTGVPHPVLEELDLLVEPALLRHRQERDVAFECVVDEDEVTSVSHGGGAERSRHRGAGQAARFPTADLESRMDGYPPSRFCSIFSLWRQS